jgi:hypothetical protein
VALGPAAIKQIHERMVQIVREGGVVPGRRLRVDTTVVETNITYPTDSTLLGDGARVLTRTMQRITKIAGPIGAKLRDRSRSGGRGNEDLDSALVSHYHRRPKADRECQPRWPIDLAVEGCEVAKISIVVPIYREEESLPELYRRLSAALTTISDDFEILLVSDDSRDRSWDLICKLSLADPRVKRIRFTRNFGQHIAISAGLDARDGDWVVVMDGDLQDRPEVIPELCATACSGYDVAFVSRRNRPESAVYRLAARSFHRLLQFLARSEYDPAHGNFSIISRRWSSNIARWARPYGSMAGLSIGWGSSGPR